MDESEKAQRRGSNAIKGKWQKCQPSEPKKLDLSSEDRLPCFLEKDSDVSCDQLWVNFYVAMRFCLSSLQAAGHALKPPPPASPSPKSHSSKKTVIRRVTGQICSLAALRKAWPHHSPISSRLIPFEWR